MPFKLWDSTRELGIKYTGGEGYNLFYVESTNNREETIEVIWLDGNVLVDNT